MIIDEQLFTERNQSHLRATLKSQILDIVRKPMNVAICIIFSLQLITSVLFIYVFVQLVNIQTKAQPLISTIAQFNTTQIGETWNFLQNSIQVTKDDVYPLLKKLPNFINQTEVFMQKVSRLLQNSFST